MKAYVDKNVCIGCGMCAGMEPSVFRMEEDGLAAAFAETTVPDVEENVRQAIDGCPVAAILEE